MQDKKISFQDYMECGTSIVTIATLSVEEIYSTSTEKEEQEDDEELLTSSSGEAVSSLDFVKRYSDDESVTRLGWLERKQRNSKRRQTTLKDCFNK